MSAPRRWIWLSVLGLLVSPTVPVEGSGWYGPPVYLADAGRLISGTPEFYWAIELKRMARAYHPPEKIGPAPAAPAPVVDENKPDGGVQPDPLAQFTREIDQRDYEAAMSAGALAAPDPKQHAAAREAVSQKAAALPPEPESEFADYLRGAWAFRRGAEHYAEAEAAWTKLLQRPAAERRWRTVWAEFMLGKLALAQKKPEAAAHFQACRARAGEGFVDSLGLAASSYGWEGRSALDQGHFERATELYLTQLATGDLTAIDSLKHLVPDRAPDEQWDPPAPEKTEAEKQAEAARILEELRAAVQMPLRRRVITKHILATEGGGNSYWSGPHNPVRSQRWLKLLEEAGIRKSEEAEYLGWVAYNAGSYALAERWLSQAAADSPAALWLRAKLLRRAGKLEEAARAMLQSWKAIDGLAGYTGWPGEGDAEDVAGHIDPQARHFLYHHGADGGIAFEQSAAGDNAALRLARGDFLTALETFRRAGLWFDAAYLAEQVFTIKELQAYVDRQPPEPVPPKAAREEEVEYYPQSLRHLLARRLAREGRFVEAAPYFPAPYRAMIEVYAKALADGANAKLGKEARAAAWFRAAWIARVSGMELIGTEGPPDGFVSQGNYEPEDLSTERAPQPGEESVPKPVAVPPLPRTKDEMARVAKTRVQPAVRFHYRLLAAQFAMKAAALLPDNSPELADVINRAGLWVRNLDHAVADRYYQVLEKRCAQTELGQAAMKVRWFVDEEGPWSQRERAAHEARLGAK